MDKKTEGALFALLSGILIGANTVVGTVIAKQANVFFLLSASLLASTPFLFLISFFTKERISVKEIFLEKKSFFETMLFRTLVASSLLIFGFSFASGTNASILLRMEPALVLLLGVILFGEKISAKSTILFFVSLAAAIIVATGGNISLQSINLGDIAILASLVFFALSYFSAKKAMQKTTALNLAFFLNLFGGIILLALSILFFPNNSASALPNPVLFAFFVLSFYVFGFWLYALALKKTAAWLVAVLLSVQVVSGLLLSTLWLGETISFVQAIGTILLIVSSAMIVKE